MTAAKHQGNEAVAPGAVTLSPCHPVTLSSSEDPLQQSAQFLKGVGPARAALLQRLGIETIDDLLFHFPRSYDDLTDIRPMAQLSAGTVQTVHGEVVEIEGKELASGRCIVSVVLNDGRHCLDGIWLNQPHAARSFRFCPRLA